MMLHTLYVVFLSVSFAAATTKGAIPETSGPFSWTAALGTLFFGAVGAALGGFLTKSGEIKAISNNIAEIKEHQKEIRAVTKQVESKIDQYYWHHQRLWDLRRDIGIEAIKQVGLLDRAFVEGRAALNVALRGVPESQQAEVSRLIVTAKDQHEAAQRAFYQALETMQLIFPTPVIEQMKEVEAASRRLIELLDPRCSEDQQKGLLLDFQSKKLRLSSLVRNEMLKPDLPPLEAP
jgi:hypothetical protein